MDLGAFSTKFEGLLGVGIKVVNEDKFIIKYLDVMKTLLEARGIKSERFVSKSADISKDIKNPEEMITFLEDFFNNMNEEIERIDIYCTRFNSAKLPSITIYGNDRPIAVRPVEFVRIISNSYPHICAWRYLSSFNDKDNPIYLDKFESDETPAWDFLSKFSNVKVLYKGDNCNCILSVADLFIRLTALLLKKFREGFNWRGLKELHSNYSWSSKTSANTLGGQTFILKHMAPYSRNPIDLSDFVNHPIVFIPHERPGGWKAKEEKQLFECLPIYTKLLNFLFLRKGSFKYFNSEDIRLVQKGDYMLVMGNNGEQMYNYLIAGDVPITKLTLDTINEALRKEEIDS